MTLIDNYFPFTSGPGSTATMDRWRLMARNFVPGGSGVLFGYLNQCAPTISGNVVTVGTGAVWIDGFYGENTSPKSITAGGNGMIVARMDPALMQIVFAFVQGQTAPTQDPQGVFEIPIAQVTGTSITDIRKFTYVSSSQAPNTVVQEQPNFQAPATGTSRSYNVIGWQNFYSSFPFTKQNSATKLRFHLAFSFFLSGPFGQPPTGGGQFTLGVSVNGGPDIQLRNGYCNFAANHVSIASIPGQQDLAGIAAGACTIQPRMRLWSANQVLVTDSNDTFSMTVKEVW